MCEWCTAVFEAPWALKLHVCKIASARFEMVHSRGGAVQAWWPSWGAVTPRLATSCPARPGKACHEAMSRNVLILGLLLAWSSSVTTLHNQHRYQAHFSRGVLPRELREHDNEIDAQDEAGEGGGAELPDAWHSEARGLKEGQEECPEWVDDYVEYHKSHRGKKGAKYLVRRGWHGMPPVAVHAKRSVHEVCHSSCMDPGPPAYLAPCL